jgi:chitin synthase
MELQFNERGRMIGCKVLNYLLDKKRVVNQQLQRKKNECNFHIFYHLLIGASPEERAALSLVEPATYVYTKSISTPFTTEDNIEHYESLKASMRHLGLGKRYHARIMQLVASILHLGQLQFVDDTTMQEAAYVKNVDCLELVAEFLGVDPRALENVLTYKTQLIKKDVTTLILNAEQAATQRDELATVLYSLLFTWLIEQMNSKLCHENIHNFIGILDFPGWATTDQASNLDKFCLNYANERVQNYVLRYIFETSGAEYKADGLEYPDVDYTTNTACVDFFDQPRHGMIDIINSYSKKSNSNHSGKSNDIALLETTIKYQTGNEAFSTKKADTGASQFIIQHFSGAQLYQPEGFIESNRDALNADFVSLFRGSSDLPPSNNTFLVNLFEDKSILTESHPKHADAIMNAQQISKPNRKPSMRRSKSTKRQSATAKSEEEEGNTAKTKKVVPVVLAQLRSSLDELFATLDETMPWFVFCIRPNHKMAVGSATAGFDSASVKTQVQALGLTSITKRFQTGSFANIFLHDEFCDRYIDILQSIGVELDRLSRAKCQATIDIFGWSTQEAMIGNSKVKKIYGRVFYSIK